MRLAATERGPQLEYAVAPLAGKGPENIAQEPPHAGGEIGRAKECRRVSVHLSHRPLATHNRTEVSREHRHLEVATEDVVVRTDDFCPRLHALLPVKRLSSIRRFHETSSRWQASISGPC